MTRLLFVLQIMIAFTTAVYSAPPERVDNQLEAVRKKHDLPAMAGAVFTTDGIRAKGVCGVRKRGERVQAGDNDLWDIGSLTKMMTATLAGTYVAEKKLAWNDKVSRFFTQWQLEAKSFDDGFAFRSIVEGAGKRVVNGETTEFRLPPSVPVSSQGPIQLPPLVWRFSER